MNITCCFNQFVNVTVNCILCLWNSQYKFRYATRKLTILVYCAGFQCKPCLHVKHYLLCARVCGDIDERSRYGNGEITCMYGIAE